MQMVDNMMAEFDDTDTDDDDANEPIVFIDFNGMVPFWCTICIDITMRTTPREKDGPEGNWYWNKIARDSRSIPPLHFDLHVPNILYPMIYLHVIT